MGNGRSQRGAIDIASQILAAEAAYQEELEAASLAGVPWRETLIRDKNSVCVAEENHPGALC